MNKITYFFTHQRLHISSDKLTIAVHPQRIRRLLCKYPHCDALHTYSKPNVKTWKDLWNISFFWIKTRAENGFDARPLLNQNESTTGIWIWFRPRQSGYERAVWLRRGFYVGL